MKLRDRIALVTGAASGIGAATARRFAREGATVAINDAKPEGLDAVAGEIRAAGAKALVLPGDVTKKADGERIVQDVTRTFGRLDILINNAGINRDAMAGVPEAIRERIIAQVPVGRIASPDEIAGVHVFLASDDAAFITGQVIFADGGMSVGI